MAKTKPPVNDSGDLGARALEIAKRRQDAVREVITLLDSDLGADGKQPENMLRAAAWLAGTSLYRSLAIKDQIEPGTPVLSDKVNEEGPKLLTVFSKLLAQFGIVIREGDLVLKVPAEHRPGLGILEVQRKVQVPYNGIMSKYGFDYLEGAKTGAVACALLVKRFSKDSQALKPGLAAGIVSMGFVEGSKTAPAPLTP